jgi:hypothetical protein
MAYDKGDIEDKALKVIQENKLVYFDELCLYLQPSRATLYNMGIDKLDSIKEAIGKNRVERKKKMRNKWEESDNATLQIAAYKLIAEDDEIAKITMSRVESTGKDGGAIQSDHKHVVEFHDFTKHGYQTKN